MREARKEAVLERAHARARGRGVLSPLYAAVPFLLVPVMRVWFRLRVSGREHLPVRRGEADAGGACSPACAVAEASCPR
jgi:hypothetical protein